MIICKTCGNEIVYTEMKCPICKAALSFEKEDVVSLTKRLEVSIKTKKYEEMVECYHILADLGYKDAETEYAKILEKGQLTPKNLDLAMKYFGRAAEKIDAFAAFKYSRLLIRENEDYAKFWLIFSAVLGCSLAYPVVAEEFSESGYESDASYFFSLAAACDDAYSTVVMAKRYYEGVGAPKNEEYAKWYMDKLKIPPIYAIKLAYKLRKVKSSEPPALHPKNYNGLLHRLAIQADRLGFDGAYKKLCEILFEKGEVDAGARLGETLIKDDNCKQNFAKGMDLLKKTASLGSIRAHVALADIYLSSGLSDYVSLALSHYEKAGGLGDSESYKKIADLYYEGNTVKKDIEMAVGYYDLAANLGNSEALKKSDSIKREREALYKSGVGERTSPEEAFSAFSLAAAMGHPGAAYRLARLYELGCGVKKNRHGAYIWYKKAAELGINEALLKLGFCYANGYGVKLDYRLAREYVAKAERSGVPGARETMQKLMERKIERLSARLYSTAMRLIFQKKFKLAKTFLELSSDLLYPKAIYTLGCLYEFGVGAEYDRTKAFSLYEEAASLSFIDIAASYKLCVLKMLKSR